MTATALDELGATPTTLSPDEKALLDEYGYLSLGPVLSAAEVAALNTHIEALLAAEGERAGIETIVVFNSHTWHGGTTNRTTQPRRAVHSYFCRRDQPQQIDQRRYIRAETLARIGEAGRTILGV